MVYGTNAKKLVLDDILVDTVEQPFGEVSGDIFGTKKLSDDKMLIYFADIAGHGDNLDSCPYNTKKVFEGVENQKLKNIIKETNSKLYGEKPSMITAFMGIYDDKEKTLQYRDCGQGALLYDVKTGEIEVLSKSGLPFGVMENYGLPIETTKKQIDSEKILFIYSDGLEDFRNSDEKPMHIDMKIPGLLKQYASQTSNLDIVTKMVYNHVKVKAQEQNLNFDDDVSIMAIYIPPRNL